MNLIDAAKTGKKIRRKRDAIDYPGVFFDIHTKGMVVALDAIDILAEDWEAEPTCDEGESK